jgi:hypothetical protein
MFKAIQEGVGALLAMLAIGLAAPTQAAAEPAAIKRIALIGATHPPSYTLKNAAPPVGYPFQFWVNRADSKKKARKFNEALQKNPQDLATALTQRVAQALRGRGYEVEVLEGISRSEDDPDNVDYDAVHADADALLHLWISEVGVYSSPLSTRYVPRVNASARLLVKGQQAYLYEEDIYFGVDAREGKAWAILPDPKYSYETFEELMAKIDEVRATFDAGVQQIASRMSEQIERAAAAGGSASAVTAR